MRWRKDLKKIYARLMAAINFENSAHNTVMRKKLGLCLGAGGARGVAHLGVIAALEEADVEIDVIAGCSMGAVIGGGYASGLTVNKMKKIFFNMKRSDLVDILCAGRRGALCGGKKLADLLNDNLKVRDFESTRLPFGCVATDLRSGKPVYMTEGNLVTAIQASAAIPMVFPPVERGPYLLLDGGVLERVPVALTKKLGADVVVAVDALGTLPDFVGTKSMLDVGLRVLAVIDCHLSKRASRRLSDICILPRLGDMSSFKVEGLKFAFERGFEAGAEAVPEIKALLRG